MLSTLKMIGVTAALSAGIVTAYDLREGRAGDEPRGKTYYDRVLPSEPAADLRLIRTVATSGETGSVDSGRKGDFRRAAGPNCSAEAWPNLSPECLVPETGTPARTAARTITIEERKGMNTSVLVRLPAAAFASR